jgi:hypothetical protein
MATSSSVTDPVSVRSQAIWALFVLAVCGCQCGCVQRRMTIRTNPPGALAYVDDYEIGTTPISTDFVYYGQRKIRLVKDGYETLTVMQPVPPPWYQIPPLDFVTENLVAGEIRDQRTFSYQLTLQRVVPTEQLLSRAENLRRGVVPVGVVAPSARAGATEAPLAPGVPAYVPAPAAPEPIPAPEGIGGQPVYPLPPKGP